MKKAGKIHFILNASQITIWPDSFPQNIHHPQLLLQRPLQPRNFPDSPLRINRIHYPRISLSSEWIWCSKERREESQSHNKVKQSRLLFWEVRFGLVDIVSMWPSVLRTSTFTLCAILNYNSKNKNGTKSGCNLPSFLPSTEYLKTTINNLQGTVVTF